MRINGFEQIKGFYSWSFSHQDKGVKPQHISLYLFLVNQNNRNNWVEWFKVPFDLAMAGSCISSKKTYYSCLDDLVKWKLIKYEKGVNNWKAPLIKLEVLKDTSTVPQSEPQPLQADTPQHIQALIQASIPQPIHNIKLLTNNLKPITDNIKQVIDFVFSLEEGLDDLNDSDFILKKSELINALTIHFNFTAPQWSQNRSAIMQFVNTQIKDEDEIENFKIQFTCYWEYKKLSKELAHNFQGYLGTPAKQFANAGWNSENWEEKLSKFKSNPNNLTKFERAKASYDDAHNPYTQK